MLRVGPYIFKQAETEQEFEQVHCLNHQTFVEEIPQHHPTTTGKLVDKFHLKNINFIVLKSGQMVGMVCAHEQPPFSVESRLPDPSLIQKPGMSPLEVRLLAIVPSERNSNIFFGLIWTLYDFAVKNQNTHLIISGVEERQKLYERLGFEPLGPAVPCGKAAFLPMILAIKKIPKKIQRVKALWEAHMKKMEKTSKEKEEQDTGGGLATLQPPHIKISPPIADARVCLLPGPVTLGALVRQAFEQPLIYHRSPSFIRRFAQIRQLLGDMVGGRNVALLNGSGTLANETVAATLAAIPSQGRGVLLINGEFGQRLAQQATRFGLKPRHLTWEWGQPWQLDEVEEVLAKEPSDSWVWGVHQESSTGILNDLPGLVRIAKKYGIRVCADCVSSIGAVPLDLSEVFLGTGSSGKSLGAVAGAALIFADASVPQLVNSNQLPSYFDLVAALQNEGPCYTFPSSTLLALEAALQNYATPEKAAFTYQRYADLGRYVRKTLRQMEIAPLADESWASPVVTTFAPPGKESSVEFVERCLRWGVAIGGQSAYLAERRFVQIATMGAVTREMCDFFFDNLREWLQENDTNVTN